ncbi:MAG: 3-dehydroquinate synthase [Planctomycetota bacterium]
MTSPADGPSSVQTVSVDLGDRSYPIEIASGLLADAADRIAGQVKLSKVVVVSDTNVAPLYAQSLLQALSQVCDATLLTVPAGESSKSVAQLQSLWHDVLAFGADRKSVVVAVGGGVVGDLAGFVAASFGRGIPFVQVPTSLLAQVDSSVGGKVGINLPGAKNIVGAFWQPQYVLIDTDVLTTLPEREYRAGLAEVIKYGVIADEQFFAYLEEHIEAIKSRDPAIMQCVIRRCCEIKAEVVRDDEREQSGRRAILNYGHTYGHALEAITGYTTFVHGEAIAIGMVCAARLAEQLGRIDEDLGRRQKRLFEEVGLPTEMPDCDHDQMLELMGRDKKVEHGQLRLILPTRMGHVELVADTDHAEIRRSFCG